MKRRLGEILVEEKMLDPDQLKAALGHQRQWGMPLARALVERGFCTQSQVMRALSLQLGLELIDLKEAALEPSLSSLVPRRVAEQYQAVPLRLEGKRGEALVVAIAAPASLTALDALRSASRRQRIAAKLASDSDIALGIRRLYDGEVFSPAQSSVAAAPAEERVFELEPTSLAHSSRRAPIEEALKQIGIELSPTCLATISATSAHFQVSERDVVARVLQDWSTKHK
jgi:hypothetical protein